MRPKRMTEAELKNEIEIKEILAFTDTLTERKNKVTITRINKRKAVIDVNGHTAAVIKRIRPGRGVAYDEQIVPKLYNSVAPVSRF